MSRVQPRYKGVRVDWPIQRVDKIPHCMYDCDNEAHWAFVDGYAEKTEPVCKEHFQDRIQGYNGYFRFLEEIRVYDLWLYKKKALMQSK